VIYTVYKVIYRSSESCVDACESVCGSSDDCKVVCGSSSGCKVVCGSAWAYNCLWESVLGLCWSVVVGLSLPVAMVYWIVAWTADMFGFHCFSRSDGALPLRKKIGTLFLFPPVTIVVDTAGPIDYI
jgi:hypothetical protein